MSHIRWYWGMGFRKESVGLVEVIKIFWFGNTYYKAHRFYLLSSLIISNEINIQQISLHQTLLEFRFHAPNPNLHDFTHQISLFSAFSPKHIINSNLFVLSKTKNLFAFISLTSSVLVDRKHSKKWTFFLKSISLWMFPIDYVP